MCNSGNEELDAKVAEWLEWDRNDTTKAAVKKLATDGKFEELKAMMLERIEFGTAGLRGKMAPGYACMNDLVIVQTAQGVLKYLEEHEHTLLAKNGIVIGYDGRHNSHKWAQITAKVFMNAGFVARLFSEMNPTPFIPFAVNLFGCALGIMVTASHNPKDDNGYKVYAKNGAQIISPVDMQIQESILANLQPLDSSWDLSAVTYNNKLLQDPLQKTLLEYLNGVVATVIPYHKELNRRINLLFVYTPLHGVGYKYMEKVFDLINLTMIVVPEQRDPHPDFPTVKFPNPEEGKSALELSVRTAEENKSNIIIANDPDADRMCTSERNQRTGKWHIFSGNETGALLAWWMLHCYKEKNPKDNLKDVYMVSSTVSSKICQSIAAKEGFNFVETLTGFKWMGNKTDELVKKGKKVIFAFEEAIGFMCGSSVLDKDGITAGYQMATFCSYLYNENLTLADKLNDIYSTYGYHVSSNSYYICHDAVKITKIFNNIRTMKDNSYPVGIIDGKYKISSVRDLTTGYDSSQPDKKAVLPVSSSTQMITFTFTNGLVCTLRTSGTEPKIKYYTEMCAPPEEVDREKVIYTLNEMVKAICYEFLQPEVHGLVPQSS